MKCTCFLYLVKYIIRDIVTASLLMNIFRSCFLLKWNQAAKHSILMEDIFYFAQEKDPDYPSYSIFIKRLLKILLDDKILMFLIFHLTFFDDLFDYRKCFTCAECKTQLDARWIFANTRISVHVIFVYTILLLLSLLWTLIVCAKLCIKIFDFVCHSSLIENLIHLLLRRTL